MANERGDELVRMNSFEVLPNLERLHEIKPTAQVEGFGQVRRVKIVRWNA